MKKETATKIVKHMERFGLEARVYEDYSGRGMYGRTTHAIVADFDEFESTMEDMGMLDEDGDHPFSCDSLGYDHIFY